MTIIEAFKNNVRRLKDGPCLHYKKDGRWRALSWLEVDAGINRYAAAIAERGIKKGDRVGILSSTRMEWTLIDMAALTVGAIVVPVYPTVSAVQTEYILKETEAKLLFVEDEAQFQKVASIRASLPALKEIVQLCHSERSEESRPKGRTFRHYCFGGQVKTRSPRESGQAGFLTPFGMTESDTATIIYTSGTTGEPKGVVMTHENIMAEVRGLQKAFHFSADNVMFSFLPLAHVLARAGQFFQLAQGCQAAYAESLDAISANLKEVRPHMMIVVPRIIEKLYDRVVGEIDKAGTIKKNVFKWGIVVGEEFERLKRRKEKISLRLKAKHIIAERLVFSKLKNALGGRMKLIISGGAPLAEDLAKFFYNVGLLALEGYGLTETMAAITVNREDDFHFGTIGKPLDGVEIKLSEQREILVRGGMVFKEYYKKPSETAASFEAGGWFKTGDVGEFSRDGFLRITDRLKDIIVTAGGKNVAPQMIEGLLGQSPFISHVAVFGDKRKFISAIVALNMDAVRRYADSNGIKYANAGDLAAHAEVRKLIASVIEEKNKQLSAFEGVKKFAILAHDFTVENGELTPTMKVKRRLIEEKYKEVLAGLYGE